MDTQPYPFRALEAKWQARWEREAWFATPRPSREPRCFVLVFPPYPNGRIHMGHVRNYTIGDAVARYKRLRGHAVLHPIGFDAFGLPNEIEAARRGLEPERLTRDSIAAMTGQLRRLGYSYDWRAALVTLDPAYYRWNQWLFLSLLERGLAYRKRARIDWCPACRTSLAAQQVVEERCWRCREPVEGRSLEQWFFRLGAYAPEMWAEAEGPALPRGIASQLRDWLGRKEGAELAFPVAGTDHAIAAFTTRPELAYGATFLAVAPDHPLAARLLAGSGNEAGLTALRERVRSAPDPAALREGLDTARKAIHPLTGEPIPIWVAASVDPDFATGAVMGNPAHDAADHAFGRAHGIAGRTVVTPEPGGGGAGGGEPWLGDGTLVNAGPFSGRGAAEARDDVIRHWEARRLGRRATAFAVRDWLISRQRGWGTPIPAVHCAGCGIRGVPVADLPVRLPPRLRDTGTGNPLAARLDFLACRCPRCGASARRETDTMDTFLDTAWYYLRSTSPTSPDALCDPRAAAAWAPADLYVGGIEIAVPIVLYGSFVAKALRDAGVIDSSLPFRRLLAHDMVLLDGRKMSKSSGNTVDPDLLVERVGADALRVLILSLAPPSKRIEWSEERLQGCQRLLARIFGLAARLASRPAPAAAGPAPRTGAAEEGLREATRRAVCEVTRGMEGLEPNVCISALTRFLYRLEEAEAEAASPDAIPLAAGPAFRDGVQALVTLLSPFAPHLADELRERLGMAVGRDAPSWPTARRRGTGPEAPMRLVVKIDARPVGSLELPREADREAALALALGNEAVSRALGRREIRRVVFVPGQVLNLVTRTGRRDPEENP